uniref:EF-hand domain-containing protein n=1 Tax=Zooxanthella nutricula TaxID=1333877 RepID=A0A6U6QA16_9DINO
MPRGKTPTRPKAGEGGKAPAVDAERVGRVFQAWDLNGDGFIMAEELASVLKKVDGKLWTDRKIGSLVAAVDRNKDGKIDYREFVAWVCGPSKPEDKDQKDRKAIIAAMATVPAEAPAAPGAGSGRVEDSPEVDGLLARIFALYDQDGDERLERLELLEGEEKRRGRLDFGPKQRKEVIEWFKSSGAEGSVADGLFLSREKWRAAVVPLACEAGGLDDEARRDPAQVARCLADRWLAPLEAAMPKKAAAAAPAPDEAAPAAPKEPPAYPLTIPFTELKDRLVEAISFNKNVLVLSSGLGEVETFFNYQMTSHVDCKELIGEMFVRKTMTKEEAQDRVRSAMTKAMNSNGFCKPLWFRFANTAFDLASLCGETVPAEVFDKEAWTIDAAYRKGFFDDGHKFGLEVEDGKKWKEFYVVISSTFDLEMAQKSLSNVIPSFDKLAVLIVDPASIA